ncbi:unnamed protein product [Arabidopsis thaliana]|nr:unnamed protein product [Arabidopsis thaliana]
MLMEGSMHEKVLALKADNNKKNLALIKRDGNEGQDCCLLHDDSIRSEETMKSNEQYSEKGNNDFGEGDVDNNDKTDKRFQELNVLALSIEERILKA